MAAFRMVYWHWACLVVIFTDFEQAKKLTVFGWLLFTLSIRKTPLGEPGCLGNPYFLLTGCLSIHFLIHPFFPPQSVRSPLATYPWLCRTCVIYQKPPTPLVTRCFTLQLLTSSLTLPWAIARFLDPFYTFSPAHCRVIRDSFPPNPSLGK